jgi:UDP-3-O-[3-hydroxymyristoyl] glucosamine N-acyltransferase
MEFTIRQVAALLDGDVLGDESLVINGLAKIEEAGPGCVSFLANLKYEPFLYTTRASAVIVDKSFVPKAETDVVLIRVPDAYSAFTRLLEEYHNRLAFSRSGVEEPAFLGAGSTIGDAHYRGAFSYIGQNCRVGQSVKIYPHAYIGNNVRIGDHCIIHSGVKIMDNCVIGSHCTLHPNAVIGSDGFGFAPQPDGSYKTIPQLGNVILEDWVSVGANTTIDCATMGSTIIRQGAKIDNLVQLAHNVEIGRHTIIASQTGISGSTKIGDHCVIAGQVGIVGHIEIANHTKVGAKSGINRTITEEGQSLNGVPMQELKDSLRAQAVYRKLPQIDKRLLELEKTVRQQAEAGVNLRPVGPHTDL